MEFGVFTSRGKAFENILRSDLFQVWVLPGAKLDQITRTLCDLIEEADGALLERLSFMDASLRHLMIGFTLQAALLLLPIGACL